jgi:formylglycine-generating enzyme required for sulfatase activity
MIVVQGGTMPPASALAGQTVAAFAVGEHEVTWGEWKSVRSWAVTNGYDLGGIGAGSADDHPVRNVNWYDVVKWCNAKSEMERLSPAYHVDGATYRSGEFAPTVLAASIGYRLPTDLEWEWAARGGANTQNFAYSGSDDLGAVAWFYDNSGGALVDQWTGRGTWPVGQKQANELGLYDMSGNVFEWCFDAFGANHRKACGGHWLGSAAQNTVNYRALGNPTSRGTTATGSIGFRLFRSLGH